MPKDSLQAGIKFTHRFMVPKNKTVPSLYPEAEEFLGMPEVFATGFLVGLLEWTCIQAIMPHLDWPHEQSVGTGIDITHCAATPPGLEVTARVRLLKVEGRRLKFAVTAHDGVDAISEGTHERFLIDRGRFDKKMQEKIARAVE